MYSALRSQIPPPCHISFAAERHRGRVIARLSDSVSHLLKRRRSHPVARARKSRTRSYRAGGVDNAPREGGGVGAGVGGPTGHQFFRQRKSGVYHARKGGANGDVRRAIWLSSPLLSFFSLTGRHSFLFYLCLFIYFCQHGDGLEADVE